MDPNKVIELAGIGISAALQIIAHIKAQHGMTDDQVLSAAQVEDDAAKAAIKGYLAGLLT